MSLIRFPLQLPPVKTRRRKRPLLSNLFGALLILLSLLAWAIAIYLYGGQ
jgi:hypothetical protein